MKDRSRDERKQLRAKRAKSGYKPARLSAETHALLRELLSVVKLRGLDELVYELAASELQRRRDVKPAIISSERRRLASSPALVVVAGGAR